MYFNKNCFDILPTIPDKSVDLIFCDLPYVSTNCKWDCEVDLDKLWIEFKRIRKDTTPIIMTCTTKFGYELISSNKKEFRFDLVWEKSKKSGFLLARKRPLCNHEMVYFFYNKQPKYNYLKYHKYTKTESTKKASVITGGNLYKPKDIQRKKDTYEPKLPTSIQPFKSIKPSNHQTGKPLDLMEFILKYWSDEGDTVLDPTFGGGSMPIMCKIMNRQFIGCEIDKKFYDDTMELLTKY